MEVLPAWVPELAGNGRLRYARYEMDHLGVDHETLSTVTFEATFGRISLAQLPPQVRYSIQTRDQLLSDVLQVIDIQIENGVSKANILEPLYESNRAADQRNFQNNLTNVFTRAGELPSHATVSRAEELNAIFLITHTRPHRVPPVNRSTTTPPLA